RKLFGVETRVGEERGGVFRLIDARRLDARVLEAHGREKADEFLFLQGAGDAADPELHAALDRVRHVSAYDDAGDGEAAARLEHAERFGEHLSLVAREIDHAV